MTNISFSVLLTDAKPFVKKTTALFETFDDIGMVAQVQMTPYIYHTIPHEDLQLCVPFSNFAGA